AAPAPEQPLPVPEQPLPVPEQPAPKPAAPPALPPADGVERAEARQPAPDEDLSAHPLSRRDPRALWTFYLLAASGLLMLGGWTGVAAGAAACAAIFFGLPGLIRPYRNLIYYYVCFIPLMGILTGFEFAPIRFSLPAAIDTMQLLFRLFTAMLLALPLLGLITPYRLRLAIEQPLMALGIGKRRVHSLSLTVTLLFRFLPLIAAEWRRFARIAAVRGKRPSAPGKVPLSRLHTVMIPFMLALLQIADRLSTALEVRGFGGNPVEARAVRLRLDRRDFALMLAGLLVFGLLAVISRMLS
uniref:energy-coupling factor transporter transmembrane component T n=1 Tax=uncultured Paenibacillus sp. TaxID=227322 RepID=UPI0028D1AAA9